MVKKILYVAILLLGIASFFYVVFTFSKPKIAFVRSSELVNKYVGMQEASQLYKDKMAGWQSNIDTLEAEFQKSVSEFNLQSGAMSVSKKRESEQLLEKQKVNIQNYVKALEEKAREEDEKMTSSVINQINSFVEQYGKSNGYDFILGTTQQGNILYANSSKDITDEVLNALNDSYKKGK